VDLDVRIGELFDVLSYAERPLSTELSSCESSRDDSSTDGKAPLRFASSILLTKGEVFDACAGLASAQRLLLADGHADEAAWAALLFENLEERLALV
jgi:hypothetical protein